MDEKKYLTVAALTKYIKYKFDNDAHLKNVLLKGEISNFKHHSRGHFYFTLKDESAQISAIMFASNASRIKFVPSDGMTVLVEGDISVFESRGSYQIYVNKMSEEGLGDLYLAYEQLKKKLSSEGLFDESHKIRIPRFPSTIAVLTSPTGAAVHDIINIVNRRYPLAKIIVYPTLVQGENAKDSIVKQLRLANKQKLADVIILGRGGGSIEDLWPFNEEKVAYEIYNSKIPIISSVGHEVDFTISDFVADLRAPTPSGAAEIAVPDQLDLLSYLEQLKNQSKISLKRLLETKKETLKNLESSFVFRDPLRLTENKSQQLDHLIEKLELLNPLNRLNQSKLALNVEIKKLNDYYQRYLLRKHNDFTFLVNKLELLNPLSIMSKGYSVAKQNGKVIKGIEDVAINDKIEILLHNGTLDAIITNKKKDEK